jgi:hypothetical protein
VASENERLRERYLAKIEGEIIAARVRIALFEERAGESRSERAERLLAVARQALEDLHRESDRLRGGGPIDADEVEAFLERQRRAVE